MILENVRNTDLKVVAVRFHFFVEINDEELMKLKTNIMEKNMEFMSLAIDAEMIKD